MLSPEKIALELTAPEALVLFEWLATRDDREKPLTSKADTATQVVFWSIEAQLEKQLVEILDPNYEAFLKEARERVAANQG